MNQAYIDTVRLLLLAVAPAIFQSPRFAMKGGHGAIPPAIPESWHQRWGT